MSLNYMKMGDKIVRGFLHIRELCEYV